MLCKDRSSVINTTSRLRLNRELDFYCGCNRLRFKRDSLVIETEESR